MAQQTVRKTLCAFLYPSKRAPRRRYLSTSAVRYASMLQARAEYREPNLKSLGVMKNSGSAMQYPSDIGLAPGNIFPAIEPLDWAAERRLKAFCRAVHHADGAAETVHFLVASTSAPARMVQGEDAVSRCCFVGLVRYRNRPQSRQRKTKISQSHSELGRFWTGYRQARDSKVKPKRARRTLVPTAKALHRQMYTAFAE